MISSNFRPCKIRILTAISKAWSHRQCRSAGWNVALLLFKLFRGICSVTIKAGANGLPSFSDIVFITKWTFCHISHIWGSARETLINHLNVIASCAVNSAVCLQMLVTEWEKGVMTGCKMDQFWHALKYLLGSCFSGRWPIALPGTPF